MSNPMMLTFSMATLATATVSLCNDITTEGLLVDLDADKGVTITSENLVTQWTNQVKNTAAVHFNYTDEGRSEPGSGRPKLNKNNKSINGRNSLVFRSDELINDNDEAFDGLITGKGYTWFTILKPYKQEGKGGIYPHAFFGNLRNSGPPQKEDGHFAGFWGAFYLNGKVWMGSRNGVNFERGGKNNPEVAGPILNHNEWYIIMGRQAKGKGTVTLELFINDASKAVNTAPYPVGTKEPSRLAIGTERNAINHQGGESFDGEMAKFLLYGRPLSNKEMLETVKKLKSIYGLEKIQPLTP